VMILLSIPVHSYGLFAFSGIWRCTHITHGVVVDSLLEEEACYTVFVGDSWYLGGRCLLGSTICCGAGSCSLE
jgi:hypothetical protein